MTKKRTRILDADVKFISLCPSGKNLMQVLYKGDGGDSEITTLVKDDLLDDQGQLTALVYAPGLDDADGHFADKEAIATMCKSFMRNGAQIDIRHNQEVLPREAAYVTECFIVKADDSEFKGTKDKLGRDVDIDGAWAIRMQIDNEDLRKAYRAGEWDGVSLFGPARVETVSKESSTDTILEALAARLGAPTEEDIDMKKEELTEVLKENNESLAKTITQGIGEVLSKALGKTEDPKPADPEPQKTEVKKSDDEVKFEGDRTNPDDIEKHVQKLRKHSLQKGVDWNDPESVAKYQEQLAGLQKSDEGEGNEEDLEPQPGDKEVTRLRKQIAKFEKCSTQGGDSKEKGKGEYAHLSKENAECAKAADDVADWLNNE